MASPDDYRFAAGGRRSTATGIATVPVANDNLAQHGDDDVVSPNRLASPEDPAASAAMNEMISRSGETGWLPATWFDYIATNSDSVLQRAGQDLKLYEALLDDDVAFSALQQRRYAITSRNWEVTPGDDKDPRSVKAADDFRNDIKAVGFDRLTSMLHYGVWFGYAVAEALWETTVDNGRTRVKLADVVVPDRRYFGFTANGELRAVGWLGATIAGQVLPPNKFLAIRTGGSHDFAFYGLGLAHWAYWPIFFKRAALKFWALYLEKLGNPTVAVEFTAADKDDPVQKGNLLNAAVAVGKDSAVLLPEGTLDKRLQILEPSRNASGGSSYQDFVNTQDDALTRVILGQTGTSRRVSTGIGSNQSDVHKDVRDEIVKADADLICEGINSTFPKWLTLWNYGPDVVPPRIYRVLDDAEDLSNVAERDVQLAGIGIKRTEASVKDVYGDGYILEPTDPKASAKQIAAAMGGVIDPETGKVIPVAAPPAPGATPSKAFSAADRAFTAADDEAIDRLIAKLCEDADPVFEAMGTEIRKSLEGVKTVEGARVAILEAVERLPIERLAKLTALPMLAERAAASIGVDDKVTA